MVGWLYTQPMESQQGQLVKSHLLFDPQSGVLGQLAFWAFS